MKYVKVVKGWGWLNTFQCWSKCLGCNSVSFCVPVCADNCTCTVPGECDTCKTGFFKNTPNDADKTKCGGQFIFAVLKSM